MNSDTANPQTNQPLVTSPANLPINQQATASSGIHGKEFEATKMVSGEEMPETTREMEIPKEVEKAGVTAIKGAIELPPEVKKLGVTQSGATMPVAVTPVLPPVALPISDQQVLIGLHAKVTNAFRWLATWCIKKLKKAHVTLKIIHGKIIRVKN